MTHPIANFCTKCGAEPGQPCIGKRGNERKAYHRERGSRRGAALVSHGYRADSPIEDELLAALAGWVDHHDAYWLSVDTQVPVGPYRADILLTDGKRRLVIECDGESYHSSRKAIQHDKRRDRFFLLQGISVMRFTGSEIRRDPRGCAAQIGLWVMQK